MEIYLAGAESRFKSITTNGDLKNIEDRFEDKNIPKTLNILMSFYYKDTTLTKNISN